MGRSLRDKRRPVPLRNSEWGGVRVWLEMRSHRHAGCALHRAVRSAKEFGFHCGFPAVPTEGSEEEKDRICVFLFFLFFPFFFFFCFLGPHLRHMEVPRLGVKLQLQLQDPSRICDLQHSSWQCHIHNH